MNRKLANGKWTTVGTDPLVEITNSAELSALNAAVARAGLATDVVKDTVALTGEFINGAVAGEVTITGKTASGVTFKHTAALPLAVPTPAATPAAK